MIHHFGSGEGSRSVAAITPKLALQLSEYKTAGFEIGTLLTDNEGGVINYRTLLQDKRVTSNPSSANKHVPEVEKGIKTLKSILLPIIYALPFKLCAALFVWLVLSSVSRFNMEPSSALPDDYSSRENYMQRAINYKQDM